MPHDDNEGLLAPAALLRSLYRVFQRCWGALGVTIPEWDELDPDAQFSWATCLEKTGADVESAQGARLPVLAEKAMQHWWCAIGRTSPPPPWAEVGAAEQLVWKALVRHLFNAMVFDQEEDGSIEQHEDRMQGYFEVTAVNQGITPTHASIAARKIV